MGVDLTCPFGISSACEAQASWSIFGADAAEVPGICGHSHQEAAMPHIPEDEEPPGEPQAAQSPTSQSSQSPQEAFSPTLEGFYCFADFCGLLKKRRPERGTDSTEVGLLMDFSNSRVQDHPGNLDPAGHVIDLVNDQLPDINISEEDKKKNLALLEEAKLQKEDEAKVSSPYLGEPNIPKGLADRKQNDQRKVSQGRLTPRSPTVEKSKEIAIEQKENFDPLQCPEATPKGPASGTGSGGKMALNSPQPGPAESGLAQPLLKTAREGNPLPRSPAQGSGGVAPLAPQGKSTAVEPTGSKVGSKAELRPPLLRGVSWDSGPEEPGPLLQKVLAKLPLAEEEKRFAGKASSKLAKAPGLKDFQIQVQPVRMQKLTKLREVGSWGQLGRVRTPGLPSELSPAVEEEESKSGMDVMPNISDVLLRKLRVHKSLPGSAPPLTEKEVENVFVQLSLAFRNDSYTLESRINQAERERNLTEENTEKELENFKASITSSASLWQHCEHRETYQKLLEDIAVLHRLAARLSSRAEMVGAVRQEKRMSKATEVMMQYVENLKRTYEKDHAELMEFKKLANQNSSRSCGPSEDGVPRTARSMSLTLGKNMPRRRVSVAVVPKFNALNLPSQPPSSSSLPSLPALSESPSGKGNLPVVTSALPALLENGKTNGDPDCEASAPMPTPICLEEISQVTKARMEEEAYNKGYQEGLKKTKELQDLKEEEEEQKSESPEEPEEVEETEEEEEKNQRSSKLEELIHFLQVMYPKLCQHWQVIWMMAAAMLVLTVVLGLYNSYNSCVEQADGPLGRSTCSAAQRDSWWSSGLQHEQPTEQKET
ncbi:Protein MRVI1 [Pteropus alecto]|uniref:Protein MRVI1 n=1 Tax=Pteropus alecto TaxID=9402 RepID=L5L3N2_PTEAL|nr:Protein MRVI1 [Pteropus alecto]